MEKSDDNRTTYSCARVLAEIAMNSLGMDTQDWRVRDKLIHDLDPILSGMLNYTSKRKPRSTDGIKPTPQRGWFVVHNGNQLDIHAKDENDHREITIVADVRDAECANLIASAPRFKQALEDILEAFKSSDGEKANPIIQQMQSMAYAGLGNQTQSEDNQRP